MFKRMTCLAVVLAVVLFFVSPSFSADYGIQFGPRMSTFGEYPTSVGVKYLQGDYAITPRIGMYFVDYESRYYDDTLMAWSIGGTFDYYLPEMSEKDLKPYIGGDVDISYWSLDDSHTSVSVTPHFGAEYWLSEKFSLSGQAGLNFGFGEVRNADSRIATTGAILVTYYF